MKKSTRIIALVLTLLMVFSAVPMSAMADAVSSEFNFTLDDSMVTNVVRATTSVDGDTINVVSESGEQTSSMRIKFRLPDGASVAFADGADTTYATFATANVLELKNPGVGRLNLPLTLTDSQGVTKTVMLKADFGNKVRYITNCTVAQNGDTLTVASGSATAYVVFDTTGIDGAYVEVENVSRNLLERYVTVGTEAVRFYNPVYDEGYVTVNIKNGDGETVRSYDVNVVFHQGKDANGNYIVSEYTPVLQTLRGIYAVDGDTIKVTANAGVTNVYINFGRYQAETLTASLNNNFIKKTGARSWRVMNTGAVVEFDVYFDATASGGELVTRHVEVDFTNKVPDKVTGVSATVEVDGNGTVKNEVSMSGETYNATVPAGVAVESDTLTLSVSEMESTGNIVADEMDMLQSYDVHVEGVSKENDVAIIVTLGEILPIGMNKGNVVLYHIENGVTNVMTQVFSLDELDAHNEFYYDPATGIVTVAMATFSEIAVASDTTKAWNGEEDDSWYVGKTSPYEIANADQFYSFAKIVGGMAKGIEKDSFKDKTVKLISDINFNDGEEANKSTLLFYPVGYYNSDGPDHYADKTNTAITSGFYTFEGTFDGDGHTISNVYQNTWEMKGDHDWYSPEEQYYRDGMGIFGKVYGGTVKNLTVDNFKSDGEITTTGVIAAYADCGATFENIAVTNCNPRVYNIGNGGIVGCVGWYAKDEVTDKVTFRNITVDNSNKISALWGSYDVACGGIVGQYYPTSGQTSAGSPKNAGIHFENCHVGAVMDVYNDVCANYQYYAYRYTGMMIGSIRENETIGNYVYPKMDGITATGCTVHYDTWNDYYYCELVANSLASYTHDHQFSRLEQVAAVNGTTITPLEGDEYTVPSSGRYNYVVVNKKDDGTFDHGTEKATCYHFVDGAVWDHADAGEETVNGETILKEDRQHYYLPFAQLFTGYGWGVTSKGIEDYVGIDTMDIDESEQKESVEKFEATLITEVNNVESYTVSDFFTAKAGAEINEDNVYLTIDKVNEDDDVEWTYTPNAEWENGEITFTGTGEVKLTIQDYHYCTPTTITVMVNEPESVEKFETKFKNGDFLYRVGNANTVAVGSLFKAKEDADIDGENVMVTVGAVEGSSASGTYTSASTWTNGTIQFNGTGVVKVSITDNNYCIPTEITLEVVDAVNATTATSATSNNVVLLNDIGSGFTVSGRYTFYGNGFTLNYTGNGQYLNNGLKQGIVTVSENGTLDNLNIKASVYPTAYMYYSEAQKGDSTVDGDKTRYHYQLSAVVAKGNATISNCYIYGARNNVFIEAGDVTIKDSVLECGTFANVQIQSNENHTVTLENVTTIQHQVNATIGDTTKIMLGAGVVVGPETNNNPRIVLNGDFKQYNWVNSGDADAVSIETAKSIINSALDATAFNHTVNGENASNLGIIYLNEFTAEIKDNTSLPYILDTVTMEVNGIDVKGQVYSLQNATESQIYSDYANADRITENGLYTPQFKYSDDLGGQYIENTDGCDEFCYREGDTIQVMFPSGDSKELNLVSLVNISKYTGQDLGLAVTCKDGNGNDVTVTDGKITLSSADEYTVTYTVTDTLFYDEDGNAVTDSKTYSWDVTVSVSLKDASVPDARFEFDTTKQIMGYGKKSGLAGLGKNNFQYLPFLAGLQIYDYVGQNSYLRFDGNEDFDKIAKVELTCANDNAYVTVTLTDGGVIDIEFSGRAASGSSTKTGTITTSNNVVYYLTDGDTSATTTTWVISLYKFTGNNGVTIEDKTQVFSNCVSGTLPTGSFSTTIKYTVNFDANEGKCAQTVAYATSASATVVLPTPTRAGYIFAGWYTSEGTKAGGAGDSYTPLADTTLYAQWGKPCTVTYNANGGSCDTTSTRYEGTALTLPTATLDGYVLAGWYTAKSGGTKAGAAGDPYTPSADITLYAQWTEANKEVTVTYDATTNGGSCATPSHTKTAGDSVTLPTPDDRTGYTFNGWYTAATGGIKEGDAGAPYTPTADITLYAQWQINSYTIKVTTSNATVKVNGTAVSNGSTVSIQYGAQVTVEVTYSETDSQSTTIKGTDGTTYTSPFSMPAQDVTINATSSAPSCIAPDSLITLADGSQVRVDSLTGDEELLVWNLETGKLDTAPIMFVDSDAESEYEIIKLIFSDGTEVKVIYEHGFFDYDLGKYVYLDENASDYIGHTFAKQNGDTLEKVTLTDVVIETEVTTAWSPVTVGHLCYFVNGMLSMPGGVGGLFNIFEVDVETMTYDFEAMERDIETYGLFTYEEVNAIEPLSEEMFYAAGGQYLKISIAKGNLTVEELAAMIRRYSKFI